MQLVPPSYLQREPPPWTKRSCAVKWTTVSSRPWANPRAAPHCSGAASGALCRRQRGHRLCTGTQRLRRDHPEGTRMLRVLHLHTERERRPAGTPAPCSMLSPRHAPPGDHVFASFDAILVNAAGCGFRHEALRRAGDDSRTKAGQGARRERVLSRAYLGTSVGPLPRPSHTTTPATCCTGKVSSPSRATAGPNSRTPARPLEESHICCGSAGVYNIMQQDMASGCLKGK